MATESLVLWHKLSKYKCHKTVSAFQIGGIYPAPAPRVMPLTPMGSGAKFLVPKEPGLPEVEVSKRYINSHMPQVGGFYILDDKGYESYSPADAFEAGYTKL